MGYQGSYWKNGTIYRSDRQEGYVRMGAFNALTGLLIGIAIVLTLANSVRIITPDPPVEVESCDRQTCGCRP